MKAFDFYGLFAVSHVALSLYAYYNEKEFIFLWITKQILDRLLLSISGHNHYSSDTRISQEVPSSLSYSALSHIVL